MPTPTTLSDLPLEILDVVLCRLEELKCLHALLLSSKRMLSRAVRHIYPLPQPFRDDDERSKQLLATLTASARGKTYFPYHLYVEEFCPGGWDSKLCPNDASSPYAVLRKLLQDEGRFDYLSLSFPADLSFVASLP